MQIDDEKIDDVAAPAVEASPENIPAAEIVKKARKAGKKSAKKAAAKASKKTSKRGPVKKPAAKKAKAAPAKKTKPAAKGTVKAAKEAKREARAKARAKGVKLRGPGGTPVTRRGDPKIASRIKRARLEKGWTQRELAKRLGCGQPTVALYEAAISGVGAKYHGKLTKLLGVKLPEPKHGGKAAA